MGLPSFSVKRPVLVGMVFLGIVIMGLVAVLRLQVELYQGENKGIISVIIRVRGGLQPTEVEKLITKPVEEALATVSHVKNLYSHSREAEGRVTLEFETGTDMNYAALEIREKFSRVLPKLPPEIEKPVIANFTESDSAIVVFAVTSETSPPEAIREMVSKEMVPTLTRVDGVASVEVYGGRERKIMVELDRDKMFAYHISVERVMDVLGRSNVNLLAGQVSSGSLKLGIRTMGSFMSVDEIGDIGVAATRQGSIIPLSEVATIKDSYIEPEDFARLNLEQNVTVYVKKTSIARTIPVSRAVKRLIHQFNEDHKNAFQAVIVTDRAESIEKAIGSVKHSLVEGMIFTSLVVLAFLQQWYFAFTVLICIPVSVIATFIFMNWFGFSINVMTMSGLALSIGILVDSSIIVLQNIVRRLGEGLKGRKAVMQGAEEVWLPLVTSQATNIVVFLPIVFIDKNIQVMYQGFAFTVAFSLIASTFVAVMLVPVLLSEWLKGRPDFVPPNFEDVEKNQTGMMGAMLVGYRDVMKWNFKHRKAVLLVTLILFVVSTHGLVKKDIDWPSSMEENEFTIIMFPLPGARVEISDKAVKQVERILSKIPDVRLFSSTVRKDEIRIVAKLVPKNKRHYSKEEIMKVVDEKGNEAIKKIHEKYSMIVDEGASSGETRKLVVNIFGYENDVLEQMAYKVAGQLQKVPGLTNLVMTDLGKAPEYSIVVDKGRAAIYGLTVKDIAESVHALIRGMRPTKFHELSKGLEIETITRLQGVYRQKIEDLQQVYLTTKEGTQVPLGEVASFRPGFGPQTIDRKDKFRYVFVKGDSHRPIETVAREVRVLLRQVDWPDDYYWRFGGKYEELMKGKFQLGLALVLSIALVYATMACLFQSYLQPLIIMVTIPLASIGIWTALTITKKPLSQPVFIGMILLAGYVVSEAIMLIDRLNHLRYEGHHGPEALVQAGVDRLPAILMTRTATIVGFLPMALGSGEGSQLWSPLAVTVIGGLLSSSLLTLFIVPHITIFLEGLSIRIKEIPHRAAGLWKPKLGMEG